MLESTVATRRTIASAADSDLTDPLGAAGLGPLLALGPGDPRVRIAVIDGPVDSAGLGRAALRYADGNASVGCGSAQTACRHGTAIAGVLVAPGSGVCPGCTVVVRPILADAQRGTGSGPGADLGALTAALTDVLGAGVDIVNLSMVVTTSALAEQ